MKRFVIVVAVALALPVAAQAKEITAVAVCGPGGCERIDVPGVGHHGPLDPDSDGQTAPPLRSHNRIELEIDGRLDAQPLYYEPRSGLVAYRRDVAGQMTWTRFLPEPAKAVEQVAARVAPFQPPRVTRVKIGRRELRDGAGTYLRLHRADGPFALPGDGPGTRIRFSATAENPWTEGSLLYYPEDDVLALGGGRFVKLSPALAADIEAARPLGGGSGPTIVPWIALGAFITGATALLALRLRTAPRPARKPEATPAH